MLWNTEEVKYVTVDKVVVVVVVILVSLLLYVSAVDLLICIFNLTRVLYQIFI